MLNSSFPPLPIEDLEHILSCTKPLWEGLQEVQFFVTGSTGFFGTWLVESFLYINERLKLGATMVALSRNPNVFLARRPHLANRPALRFYQGDVRSFIFPKEKFSHIIHAATTSSEPVVNEEMLSTICQGTKHTLEFAVQAEAKHFLFVSSGAVYGELSSALGPVSETCSTAPNPMNPASAYGEGKRVAELLCALYHERYQLETMVARCFAFAGPYLPLDVQFALGNFLQAALEKKPIVIKGDGTSVRSYLYAADLAVWLWTILFQGTACRPYNVGSEVSLTIRGIADQVHQECGSQEPIQIGSGGAPTFYVPNTARAQQELGLREHFSLREIIRKHIDWLNLKT